MVDGKVVIARILHGGLIHKQGLLQVGDRIVKVNHEEVGSMTPLELQDMLKGSSGSLVITVEPSVVEPHFFGTQVYVKAHFNYNPEVDRILPAREAGLPFSRGDILEVLSQEDTFWWQASKYGSHSGAGLIPSQQLEERRKTFNLADHSNVGCMGRRKPKRQLLYSSHHNGTFEPYDVILYEKVNLIPDFKRKTLLLIGSQYIGRRELKQRLVEDQPDKYGEVRAHTTKGREPVDVMEGAEGYYHVTEEAMKADIQAHKFIEYGRHHQHLYGIKSDNILEVIQAGKMVVLDVYPQTIKMVRTSAYSPLIVFIKPSSLDGMRQLYQNVAMQQQTQPSQQKRLTDVEFKKCLEESEQIEKLYSHYFDATIVNDDIDITYEELLTVIKKFTSGPQWVPTGWVM
jgi:guanylate kinase